MPYSSDLYEILSSTSGRYDYFQWERQAIEKVSGNGLLLANESEWWSSNENVVIAAVSQNALAIRYTPKFQDNKMIAMIAVKTNGLAKFWLDPSLQNDPDIERLAKQHLPIEYYSQTTCDEIFLTPLDRSPPLKYILDNQSDFYNRTFCVQLENFASSRFIRDSHVALFSGKHLLPYSIESPLLHHHLRALLPSSASHFFIDEAKENVRKRGMVGTGFYKQNVEQAMITAYDYGLSFKRAKTCIEGGNCFLFVSNNQKKAIVGELSLYLSMIALEEQGCLKITTEEFEPALESYRMARNLDLYNKIKKPLDERRRENSLSSQNNNQPQGDQEELAYRQMLVAPVSDEDRLKYLEEARILEVKLDLTKIYIARDLELSLENVAYLPQDEFHEDMRMFVTPQGEVVLHDYQKTVEFLEEIKSTCEMDEAQKELWIEYRNVANANAVEFQKNQEMRKQILTASNIDFRLLPLILEAPSKSALNYCNGIFVGNGRQIVAIMPDGKRLRGAQKKDGFTFITTGPSVDAENVFHQRFLDIFQREFPKLTFQGVPTMSKFIAEYHGGIHCLTFEGSLVYEHSSSNNDVN